MKDEKTYEVVFDPRDGMKIIEPEETLDQKSYRGLRLRTKMAGGWIIRGKPKPPKKPRKPTTGKPKKKAPAKKRTR